MIEESEVVFAKRRPQGMFEYQAPAVLNQAAPVNGTQYTILDTTEHVRLYTIAVNVEDVNETLEVQITIDGEIIAANDQPCAHSTAYYVHLQADAISRVDLVGLSTTIGSINLEGHSVKVEVRKTTATGAGNLTGIVMYGVLKDV